LIDKLDSLFDRFVHFPVPSDDWTSHECPFLVQQEIEMINAKALGWLQVEGRALRGHVCHVVYGFLELSPPEFPV
jgi:hypothetical protein